MHCPGFKGIARRFSYEINTPDRVYVDDYAHHPTAINAIYQTLRAQYPNKKITAIFQPHLYSRTQDFAHEFAASLSQFDSLFLLDIYPAREQAIEGVTSEWLLGLISSKIKSKLSCGRGIEKP
jgi:UDP-N-acetylmuramate--alanine ligase